MRCLLVENHLPLRNSIRECLVEAGYVVDDCGSGDEGLWSALNHSYAAIILDVMLPEMDGIEVLRRLRLSKDPTPVILVSARGSTGQAVEGLNAGADDFLIKPFDLSELMARVRALTRRRYSRESPVFQIGDLQINTLSKKVVRGRREVTLTPLEYRILCYLGHREDQVVSQEEIGQQVYQDHDVGNSNKVAVYIAYLRKKLNAAGDADLLRTVRGRGYSLSPDR